MKLKTLTVSQVNDYISSYIYTNPIFSNIVVCGEVFNLKYTNYGYTFLSLKDNDSKLNAMTYLEKFDVKEGDSITVYGKINFYKKSGTYSLIINNYEKNGQGDNYEQFKLLYEKLENLGYFDKNLKKDIVKFPQNIGIITSARGAAIKDIISVIERRYPKVDILIYDSKMQGEGVEQRIIDGIRYLNDIKVDTIIISRGGGDMDDLSVFNSQKIAQSIFESKRPIISAIGHEIDFVICDFVSDMRASTPSIAGELSVPDINQVYDMIEHYKKMIESSYKNKINKYNIILNSYRYIIQKNAPYKKINQKKLQINEIKVIIKNSYIEKLKIYKDKLIKYNMILQENNYKNILSKGFAIIKRDSDIIKSSKNLKKDDILVIKFKDGDIRVKVEEII